MRLKVFLLLMCVSISGLLLAQDDKIVMTNNFSKSEIEKPVSQEAYLGVKYSHVSKNKSKKLNFPTNQGVYVTRITKGSAAAKAGLQAFDYLTGINGKAFSENMDFGDMMDEMKPNQTINVNLIRQEKPITIEATLTARPDKTPNLYKGKYAFLGVSPSHNKIPDGIEGTRVSNITTNSTAQAMGITDNDIIQYVNDNPIMDWHDLNTAMKNTAKGDDLKVVFYRESDEQTRTKTMTAVRHGDFVDVPTAKENTTKEIANQELTEIEEAIIEMTDISEAESEEMEKAEIDMPVINTLSVENLRLFPNPNNGIFNLNFNLNGEDEVTIRVFSDNGQVIYQDNLGEFSGEYLEQINISNNAKGIYFLQVRQGENVLSKKIILK